jgi:hypothetical protein
MLGDFPPAQVDVHDISASVCGGGANGTMFTCVIVRESPPRRSYGMFLCFCCPIEIACSLVGEHVLLVLSCAYNSLV